VGYLVHPEPFRRAALELQVTITGCAPSMAQRAAQHALAHGQADAEAMRVAYERRRDLALELLQGSDLVDGTPEGAFYLWLDVQRAGLSGLDFTALLANEADVVVSAGEVYGSDRHVRVSIAAGDDALRAALGRLRATVEQRAQDRSPSTPAAEVG
jgi:aspartate/methionine/tyrosine aminotransferase